MARRSRRVVDAMPGAVETVISSTENKKLDAKTIFDLPPTRCNLFTPNFFFVKTVFFRLFPDHLHLTPREPKVAKLAGRTRLQTPRRKCLQGNKQNLNEERCSSGTDSFLFAILPYLLYSMSFALLQRSHSACFLDGTGLI